MAHEIREMFVTLVQVGSRKYTFICSVLTSWAYSLLMKWSGINKWGKRVSIRDIYICFVLQFAQVVRGVACHAMFTDFTAKLLFQRLWSNFLNIPKTKYIHIIETKKRNVYKKNWPFLRTYNYWIIRAGWCNSLFAFFLVSGSFAAVI